MTSRPAITVPVVWRNLLAGLTVSFVAISLGAAFGILSGRGAFAGIVSAGIIALVTSVFGGTRVQCSGPTAPMTAVTTVVVVYAHGELLARVPGADPGRFVDMVLLLGGALMVLMAVARLGRFVFLVPKVVISGFMDGIAILIWVDQAKKLTGFGDRPAFAGAFGANLAVALATLLLAVFLPRLLRRTLPAAAGFVPATLLSIVAVTVAVHVLRLDVELVGLKVTLSSWSDLAAVLRSHVPTGWTPGLVLLALPFAFQIAMLGYLDTLLTSLVIDRMNKEQTRLDKELAAQGLANGAVALVGGIPGAQATIRSVLILKEGATLRLAGVMVGVFVLLELVIFQEYVSLIPSAAFAGILLKVGFEVFDWLPFRVYNSSRLRRMGIPSTWLRHPEDPAISVSHTEAAFIVGTTAVTVFWDLNVAVVSFVALFHVLRRFVPVRDLEADTAFADQG